MRTDWAIGLSFMLSLSDIFERFVGSLCGRIVMLIKQLLSFLIVRCIARTGRKAGFGY